MPPLTQPTFRCHLPLLHSCSAASTSTGIVDCCGCHPSKLAPLPAAQEREQELQSLGRPLSMAQLRFAFLLLRFQALMRLAGTPQQPPALASQLAETTSRREGGCL